MCVASDLYHIKNGTFVVFLLSVVSIPMVVLCTWYECPFGNPLFFGSLLSTLNADSFGVHTTKHCLINILIERNCEDVTRIARKYYVLDKLNVIQDKKRWITVNKELKKMRQKRNDQENFPIHTHKTENLQTQFFKIYCTMSSMKTLHIE